MCCGDQLNPPSKSDLRRCLIDVRSSPNSRHAATATTCRFCANIGSHCASFRYGGSSSSMRKIGTASLSDPHAGRIAVEPYAKLPRPTAQGDTGLVDVALPLSPRPPPPCGRTRLGPTALLASKLTRTSLRILRTAGPRCSLYFRQRKRHSPGPTSANAKHGSLRLFQAHGKWCNFDRRATDRTCRNPVIERQRLAFGGRVLPNSLDIIFCRYDWAPWTDAHIRVAVPFAGRPRSRQKSGDERNRRSRT
jgi:hypothetical protein